MEDIRRIIFLIKERIDGSADDARDDELRRWLAASEKNRRVFERILERENLRRRLDFRETFDKERLWRSIIADTGPKRRTGNKRSSMRLNIARYAAVGVFAAASLFAFHQIRERIEARRSAAVAAAAQVDPVENTIYLELNDGSVVALGESSEPKTVNVAGAVLSEENDALTVGAAENTPASGTLGRIIVPRGRSYKVVLPDGTEVWINSGSSLELPNAFGDGGREVSLRGEAYFEVAEDSDRPFVVHAGDVDVRVLGTSFNVNRYGRDVITTLVGGRVSLDTPAGNYDLTPGSQGVFSGGAVEVKSVSTDKYTAWVRGMFMFDNDRLEDIMDAAARWYDTEAVFAEDALKELHFTCSMPRNAPLGSLLRILEGTKLVKFNLTDGVVTISAG